MAKMNVSKTVFARALNASIIVEEDGQKFICLDKLALKSGLQRQSAAIRLYQWRKAAEKGGVKFPWPPTKSEGRGGKKLDFLELAAIAAEWEDPSEEGEEGEG